MNVFEEFAKILKSIEEEKIQYALVGGVSMAFYVEPRFTQDIDLLLRPDDFLKMKKVLEVNGYLESTKPWTFQNTPLTLHRFFKAVGNDQMLVDLLVAGSQRHL
jgi:predicted nucleotidyltransferase